ncbi:hypothetical protein NBRC116188_04970 [Oceaniserpentilla sp. 4NH20-0058]|uniref:hypothetical protein n=1 Tax=Oceaniserpentilla sp. 4NH20-0058 TaxID=3127660 RepID=UPI003106BA05
MKNPKNIQEVLQDWESHTLNADQLYHQKEFKKASKGFAKSVDIIEPWLERGDKELNTILHLFVLSCHNTAHALYKQGKKKEAEYYYSHAHFRLLSLVSQPKPSSKVLELAVLEIKATFNQLKTFLESMNKSQLAGNIKEESQRVLRQSYMEYVDDMFVV